MWRQEGASEIVLQKGEPGTQSTRWFAQGCQLVAKAGQSQSSRLLATFLSGFECSAFGLVMGKQTEWFSMCLSPGHHPCQPGPSFPCLHRILGGLQSLHLRPQLPRRICL